MSRRVAGPGTVGPLRRTRSALRLVPVPTRVAWVALVVAITLVELGVRGTTQPSPVDVPVPSVAQPAIERLRSVPLVTIHDPEAAAIASGVVFGRTDDVSTEDQAAFLDSGLWHLLAASGQNIALVATCCILLARGLGAGRTTGAVLALVAIPLYVAIVGSGASIVRAGLMGELGIAAWLAGRLPDLRHLLVVVAAAICWAWPGAHRGLGMQLSFACVVALALWAVPATRWFTARGVPEPIAAALVATLLCSGVTAPILVLRTGSAPLLGTIANAVAVPLAGAILVVGLAGSSIALLADAVGHPALADLAMAPVGWLASLLLAVAHRAAALPAAQTTSHVAAIGVPLAALVLALVPADRRRLRQVALAVGAACLVTPALHPVLVRTPLARLGGQLAPPPAGALRIASLDIGQGDATLVWSDHAAVLIDTGPPDGRVVDRVRAMGVDHVDAIVLTHDSLDHRGGFPAALAALHPDWVGIPRHGLGDWGRVRAEAPRIVELCAGSRFSVGTAELDIMHPRCDGTVRPHTSDRHNDAAMVTLVRHGEVRAVVPADAEAPVLLDLDLPGLDLLRVSHHGSADPDLPALLARVHPDVASISVGEGNSYGHPTATTLHALDAAGVEVHRTDREGTIVFESDGHLISLLG